MRITWTGRLIVRGAMLSFLLLALASATTRGFAGERRLVGILMDAAHREPLTQEDFRFVRGVRDGVFPWQLGEEEARGTTDAEGRFEVDLGFAPAARHFSVEVEGYAPALFFADPDAFGTTTLDLSLYRPGRLEVKMPEAESLKGELHVTGEVHSLQISGRIGGPRPWATFERSLVLPSVGPILFEDMLPRATLWLRWEPDRGLPVDGPTGTGVSPGNTQVYDFSLPVPPVSLQGRVRDQFGEPRSGDEVVLFQHPRKRIPEEVTRWVHTASPYPREYVTVQTDNLGVFSFEDLSPGNYWIASFEPKLVPHFRCEIHRLIVPSGVTSHEVELVFPRGLALSGKVLSDTTRHRDETVRLRSVDPALQVNLTAPVEDGAFYFGALPEGRYELRAVPGDFDKDHVVSEGVNADAGTSGVALELRPAATLSGSVLGGGGRSQLDVLPPIERSSPFGSGWNRTGMDGSFEIGSLTPGTRRIVARQFPNLIGVSVPLSVEVGESKSSLGVHLELGAALIIEHQLGPRKGTCRVTFEGLTLVSELRSESETTRIIVPAGRVSLRIEHGSLEKAWQREFDVVAGEEREVALDENP